MEQEQIWSPGLVKPRGGRQKEDREPASPCLAWSRVFFVAPFSLVRPGPPSGVQLVESEGQKVDLPPCLGSVSMFLYWPDRVRSPSGLPLRNEFFSCLRSDVDLRKTGEDLCCLPPE